MLGILVSFWDGQFSGAMLVLGSVYLIQRGKVCHADFHGGEISVMDSKKTWLKQCRANQNHCMFQGFRCAMIENGMVFSSRSPKMFPWHLSETFCVNSVAWGFSLTMMKVLGQPRYLEVLLGSEVKMGSWWTWIWRYLHQNGCTKCLKCSWPCCSTSCCSDNPPDV